MASNYEVNIKLNTRTVNKQLNNLEKRISKLNKLAQGGKANRTVLRNEQEKIKKTGQRLGLENKILRQKKEQLKVDQQQLRVEQQTANAINKQRSGGGGGRAARSGGGSGVLSSAVISGAFPLLFGQGPLVGAAGALGGGIGGMFGQMGGFAGGIAATTVATTIQAFTVETGKLGAALNDATKDVEAVSAALGITGTEFEKNLKTLQKLGGEEEAFEAARQKMINLVGKEGVDALQQFGKGTTELANQFTIAMTQMKAGLASFLQGTGVGRFLIDRMTSANLVRQAKTSTDVNVVKAREIADAFNLGPLLRSKEQRQLVQESGFKNFFEAIENVEEQQKIANKKAEQAEIDKLMASIQKQRVKSISDEIALLERSFGMTSDEFEIEKQIMQMKEDGEIKDEAEIRNKLKHLQNLQKERQLAEETAAAFERMSQTIATDISQGIQGLIRGTSTLNDMLNNVLNKLIDAAFNMAFFGNMQGTLGGGGLFGSILGGLGGLFGGGGGSAVAALTPEQQVSRFTFMKANGGSVRAGNDYIVGERGPELFSPGVSGMITPNHALGGTTNIVVNVDASGSNVEGDEEQGRELGRMISAAIQSELIKQKRPGGMLA